MKKVNIQICLGTTCFVMGGGALQTMAEELTRRFGDKIAVSGVTCLGACSEQNSFSKAPFVKIDDDIIGEATIEKIAAEIEKRLQD